MNGLLVYSGGLDSTTLLYEYKDNIKLCISFEYCSRQNPKELECSKFHTKKLGIPHEIVQLDFFKTWNRFLRDPPKIDGPYREETVRSAVIPFRDGIMLAIAVGMAEDRNLDAVYVGIHAAEHAIYLDCRPEFINCMKVLADLGTYQHIQILNPYVNKNKREIALIGKALGIGYNKTWSCYLGHEYQCGNCGTCLERKEALQGFDSTIYEKGE